jgi:hypothetical protein
MVRTMLRARHLLPAAAIAAGLTLAGQASAATYCVHQSGTCPATSIDSGANLPQALAAAAASSANDRIDIGPGTFTAPAGGFNGDSLSSLSIHGSGPSTLLTGATTPIITIVGTELRDVAILSGTATGSMGIVASGGSSIVDSAITDNAKSGQAIVTSGYGELYGLTIASVGINGVGVTGMIDGGEAPSLINSSITATTPFVALGIGSAAQFTLSRVTTYGPSGVEADSAAIAIDNSVLHQSPAGNSVLNANCATGNQSGNGKITANHVSLFGPGGAGTALQSTCSAAGKTSTVSVSNSTIHDFQHLTDRSASAGSTAFVGLAYTDAAASPLADAGNGAVSYTHVGAFATPKFVDAEGRIAADSPLIDQADPLAAFNQYVTDRDGDLRLSGPRQDLGAYEFQVPAPVPPADPGNGGGGNGGGGGGGNGGGGTGTTTTTAGSGDATPTDAPTTPPSVTPTADPARPAAPAPIPTANAAQLRRALRAAIKTGTHGTHTLTWPIAGRVTFEWRAHGRLVARGTATRTVAGRTRVTVKRLHAIPPHARVSVRATFTPAGGRAITVDGRLAR